MYRQAYALRFSSILIAALTAASFGAIGCGSGIIGSAIPAATPTASPSAVQSGPQLGYIWSDKTHTLRPVLGVAGSSQLGQSVVSANLYVAAGTSAVSNLAVLQEADGTLDLMSLPSGQPARLGAALAPGAQIRFSPSGLNAVAFVPGSSSALLLSNLATTPQAATLSMAAPLSEAAVSDSKSIAGAFQTGSGVTICTISAAGSVSTAATLASLGGMAFQASSDDLLLADASANSLTLVRNAVTSPSPTLIQSASLLRTPQGLGVSRDGRFAVLANTANTNIVRIDLTAQTTPRSFACDCQPALVAQLAGTSVFRVTPADAGPAWMLDASATNPRMLFIPANKIADIAPGKN